MTYFFRTGKCVKILQEEKPEKISWKDVPVAYVIESSGKFTEQETVSVNTKTIFITISCNITMVINLLGGGVEMEGRYYRH